MANVWERLFTLSAKLALKHGLTPDDVHRAIIRARHELAVKNPERERIMQEFVGCVKFHDINNLPYEDTYTAEEAQQIKEGERC